jgi:hypothetical protein
MYECEPSVRLRSGVHVKPPSDDLRHTRNADVCDAPTKYVSTMSPLGSTAAPGFALDGT